jgi:putative N6-adenine-specific DNA methylase
LGASKVSIARGGVAFEGDQALLYKANLQLRTAMRVLIPIARFPCKTAQMLYDGVKRVRWERNLTPERTFAIHCVLSGAKPTDDIRNSHFAELKAKDAIADRFREKTGRRPSVDKDHPHLSVHLYIRDGQAEVSLDSSGASLHERGYRQAQTEAPLKETLAAAILELGGWDGKTPLLDPMCGSGTFPIEAALIARKIPPGLAPGRKFSFMNWPDYSPQIWEKALEQARAQILESAPALIFGFDLDPQAIRIASLNAKQAGVGSSIQFLKKRFEDLEPPVSEPGFVVINPPYSERLGEKDSLVSLYQQLGDVLKQRFTGWTALILSGEPELAKKIGLKTAARIKLFNGPIECRLLKFSLHRD